METEHSQRSSSEKNTRRRTIFLWCLLRLVTFGAAGLYLCILFAYLSCADPRRLFWWLPPALIGAFMILFAMGLLGRWRYLWAISSLPTMLIGFPWLDNTFHWDIEWFSAPSIFVGTCFFLSLAVFGFIHLSYRKWPAQKERLSPSFFRVPSLTTRTASILIGAAFFAYGLSYVRLSLGGRYEPEWADFNGVHAYSWAPRGFVRQFRPNSHLTGFYLGLLETDRLFWHSTKDGDEAHLSNYPVDLVKPEDLDKLYREWDMSVGTIRISPDSKYRIYIGARPLNDRKNAFVDRTPKAVRITIVKNLKNMDSYDVWDKFPSEITLFTNEYTFECSDACFATSWDRLDGLSVNLYDYGPDVYQEDAARNRSPSNHIATLTFAPNRGTGKFGEKTP